MDKTISINSEYYRLDRKMSKVLDEGEDDKFITLVFTRTDAHKMSGNNTFAFTIGFNADCDYDAPSHLPFKAVIFHEGIVHHGFLESSSDDPTTHTLNVSEGYASNLAAGAAPVEVYMMALDIIKKKFTI